MITSTAETTRNVALPPAYRLGEYVIQSVLGQGGFGITYLARDTKLSSRVAIKEYFPQAFAFRDQRSTINPRSTGEDNYTWGLQEFLKEARALAKFKHNHIVRVLRFLEANGTAYMVMEYEEGESLDQYLRKSGGLLNEAMLLGIFLPVLSGLQAVHDAGMLHLDIKPENIYLRTNGQPMLIDFGSARRARARAGHDPKVALTPGFAAPEQYPNLGKQGPSTDVYSMGASLYRCVTGQQPVDALERFQSLRQRKIDPHRPATTFERPLYVAHIRECIDWAMKLSPKERPHTAHALQRGLMGQGMHNDPALMQQGAAPSYRSGFIGIPRVLQVQEEETVKRGVLAQAVLALLALLSAGVLSVFYLLHTEAIREQDMYDAIDQTRVWVSDAISGSSSQAGKETKARAAAARATKRAMPAKLAQPFEPNKTLALKLSGHPQGIDALAFLPEEHMLASASADGSVRLWDLRTAAVARVLETGSDAAHVAGAPDGQRLALSHGRAVILWEAKSDERTELGAHEAPITHLAFSPNGQTLASIAADRTLILWNVPAQRRRVRLQLPQDASTLAFSPDGRRLATADGSGEIRYWESTTGKLVGYFRANEGGISAIAFSPDGNWLASGGPDGFLKLWDVGIERRDQALANAAGTVQALLFSPDGKWLIVGGAGTLVEIRSVAGDAPSHQLVSDHPGVAALALSADGTVLASGGTDGSMQVWK